MFQRRYTAVPAPFGVLYLTVDDDRLTRIDPRKPTIADALRFDGHPLLRDATDAVRAYFEGRIKVPPLVCNEAFSIFQQAVFDAVKAIPYGQTRTAEAIAEHIGRPDAARAVSVLCQSNPLWIAVPTHRVLTESSLPTVRLSAQEILRRMERRYACDGLTKRAKEGKLF